MKSRILTMTLGCVLTACGGDFPVSPGVMNDWKCTVRDSNGNLYFGFDRDRSAAMDKARWQCVSGSPYKPSCKTEPADCEQIK